MAGDARSALERLFREHGRTLVAFLYRRTGNHADAIEFAQETYYRTLKRMLRIQDLAGIGNLKGYMFAVAANLATEQATRPGRDRAVLDISDPALEAELSNDPNFAGQIDEELSAGRLNEVLAELPVRCRNAFWLQHVYGMSYDEIARHFGVSRETIKKDLSKAMLHCRQRLEPPVDEPTEPPGDEPTGTPDDEPTS